MITKQTNDLLDLLMQSSDVSKRELVLSALLTDHAEPIISKIVRYKMRGATDDGEEIYSEVMLELVSRLQRLQSEENC